MRDEEGPSGFGQVSLIGIVSFGPRLVFYNYTIFKKSFKKIIYTAINYNFYYNYYVLKDSFHK